MLFRAIHFFLLLLDLVVEVEKFVLKLLIFFVFLVRRRKIPLCPLLLDLLEE